jgi:ribonuclease HII
MSVPTDTPIQRTLFESKIEGLDLDRRLRADGFTQIAGIDEAGRGPLAGPVVAAVVIMTPDLHIDGLNDSKKMTEARRERAFAKLYELRGSKVFFGIGQSSAEEIDEIGILPATFQAMSRSVEAMISAGSPDIEDYLLIIDGRDKVPNLQHLHQMPIIGGDGLSPSIAAASVLAKVSRDRQMVSLSEHHPNYGFEQHKGYGTKRHMEALNSHGPCSEHRRSFAPVKKAEGKR